MVHCGMASDARRCNLSWPVGGLGRHQSRRVWRPVVTVAAAAIDHGGCALRASGVVNEVSSHMAREGRDAGNSNDLTCV